MIWNPWKEIKRLRGQVDLYVNMSFEEGRKAMFRQSDIDYLQEKIDAAEQTLLAIAAEEKPTSNATVKRICKMAREALAK